MLETEETETGGAGVNRKRNPGNEGERGNGARGGREHEPKAEGTGRRTCKGSRRGMRSGGRRNGKEAVKRGRPRRDGENGKRTA